MAKAEKNDINPGKLAELSELERLKRDVYRPDMEKLQLVTKMLRENMALKSSYPA